MRVQVYLLNRLLYLLNEKEILEKSGKFVNQKMWEACVNSNPHWMCLTIGEDNIIPEQMFL